MTSTGLRVRRFFLNVSTTLGRRRIVGVVFLAALLGTFYGVSDPPRLDDVRDAVLVEHQGVGGSRPIDEYYGNQVDAAGDENCFQGFCYGEEESLAERWLDFSIAYLTVVGWLLGVALAAAALVDAFLFPTVEGPARGKTAFRLARPASTLSPPALTIIFILFTPALFLSRLALALVAVLGVGAIVARSAGTAVDPAGTLPEIDEPHGPPETWGTVVREGLGRTGVALWRYAYRLAPLFVVAALVGGLVIQYVDLPDVEAVLGDHVLGIVVAAGFGLLLDLWRMWAIPLVAALVLIGMGGAPAAALLFTAAAGGLVAFHRIGQESGRIAALRYMAAIGVLGVAGGLGVLAWDGVASASASAPTVTFDGVTCQYDGPATVSAGTHDFVIDNQIPLTVDTERFPMAFVVGRLAEGATIEGFAADVAADPQARLPAYFTETGAEDFIFPETTETVQFVFHAPGRYASVCMVGGAFYVIQEFSMVQPPDWFEEFRDTYTATVAPEVFSVEG